MIKVKRALISVSDKKGIDEFVKGLHGLGVEIISTGGTAKLIKDLGIPVRLVSDYTGFPEMLDGRVKTLHPKIHGALLSVRDNPEHMKQVKEHGIELIDMVIVNLYPFEQTIQKEGITLEEAVEQIDIGGPSMLRSASKNFKSVVVVCNPAKYKDILKELKENNCSIKDETSAKLAAEVFMLTSAYDANIAKFLGRKEGDSTVLFPEILDLRYKKIQDLRYGENPHQKAVFYGDLKASKASLSSAKQLHGKELSFNNLLDLNAALEIVKDFDKPTASIIKHTNPCGAASAETLVQAYKDALDCDRLSAFGSIVGLNKQVDSDTAKEIISADFVECIIAPSYDEKALKMLEQKKNLRILEVAIKTDNKDREFDFKKVSGGLLIQELDTFNSLSIDSWKVVTKKKPTNKEMESLLFGWKIAKHVKSNAIVLCRGTKTVGVGAGQMSRVESVIIAVRKAGKEAKGSLLASDAFFPKADGIQMASEAGIKAIVQPGGSIRDDEVIKAADEAGISMVFTGERHFKH